MSKGSKQRPMAVTLKEYEDNYQRIFRKDKRSNKKVEKEDDRGSQTRVSKPGKEG